MPTPERKTPPGKGGACDLLSGGSHFPDSLADLARQGILNRHYGIAELIALAAMAAPPLAIGEAGR